MVESVHLLSPLAYQWFADSPLSTSADADAYLRYLHERGYAEGAIKEYFNGIAHLAHWLKAQEADLTDTGDHPRICRSGPGDEGPGTEKPHRPAPSIGAIPPVGQCFTVFAELIVM